MLGLDQASDEMDFSDAMPTATEKSQAAEISTAKSRRGRNGQGNEGEEGDGKAVAKPVHFFGEKGEGRSFVFVIDCSGSMSVGTLQRANQELVAALEQLHARQDFSIIYFNHETFQLGWPRVNPNLIAASLQNRKQAVAWMSRVIATGGTDPRDAMTKALAMRPDTIFLLTDGAIPSETRETVKANNLNGTMVNTIGIGGGSEQGILQDIAKDNDGHFRFVP